MDLWKIPALEDRTRRGVFAAAALGLIAFSATLIWTATGVAIRLPWYEPLERRWILSVQPPTNVSMDFYARVALSFVVALVVGAIGGHFAKRRVMGDPLLRAIGIWAFGWPKSFYDEVATQCLNTNGYRTALAAAAGNHEYLMAILKDADERLTAIRAWKQWLAEQK